MTRTVFLSYRRAASWPAHLVQRDLTAHGFDVFLDVDDLGSGDFTEALLHEIETREHFLVLLVPGSLDRIGDERDWLRREIRHALAHRRNVVPLLADGFEMPDGHTLPADVAALAGRNAVVVPAADYLKEAMVKLLPFLGVRPPSPGRCSASEAQDALPGPPAASARGDQIDALQAAREAAPRVSAGPPDLRPIPTGDGIILAWTGVAGAVEYEVESSVDPGFATPRRIHRGRGHSIVDTLPDRAVRYYRVRAVGGWGEVGPWSTPVPGFWDSRRAGVPPAD